VSDSHLASPEPRYAGLPRRLAAVAIDALLAWVALAIAANVLVPGAIGNDPTSDERATLGLITLLVITAWFNYLVISEWRWGQTLGKRALRIAVGGDGGRAISWNRALVRNLALLVDVVAGPVSIVLSARRQRIGDRLARTVVVVKRRPRSIEDRQMAFAAGGDAATSGSASAAGATAPSAPPPTPSPPGASPAGPSPTWGPARVAGGIGVLLVATLVEVGVVSAFDPDLSSLGAKLVAQALLAITLVGVAFTIGAVGSGAASPQALGLRRPLRSPIGLAAAAYLGYIVIAVAYSSFVHPQQEDVTRDLGFGHGVLGALAAGILIVVAAPVSEEIFFRGFIFGGLRRRLSFPLAAVISALIFGVFHYTGPGTIGVVPQLAFLGFALAWVYEETGSIYPTVAIHAINNGLAFALLTSS
jgi:membrane protease YdiL (CAAX protease family)/uncharacterized RDD family membrane protein YckC